MTRSRTWKPLLSVFKIKQHMSPLHYENYFKNCNNSCVGPGQRQDAGNILHVVTNTFQILQRFDMSTYGAIRPSSTDILRLSNSRQLPSLEKTLSRPGSVRSARSASSLERYEERRDALGQGRPASASAALGESTLPTYTMRIPPQVSEAYHTNATSTSPSSRGGYSGFLPTTPEKENGFGGGALNATLGQKRPSPTCSDTIRRTVNSLQFANVADKLDGTEDKERRRNGWHLDEPQLEVVQVMAYMRQRVMLQRAVDL